MADRIIAVVKSEISRISSLTFRAIKSGAYFYPFHGIIYLLSHQTLRQPLQSRIMPTLTLGIGVTTAMFCLAYVPQMALLALTSGPVVAPVSAALLVINESSAVTRFLSSFFASGASATRTLDVDAFDATLVLKGYEGLVAERRDIKSGRKNNVLDRLGGGLNHYFSSGGPSSSSSSSPLNRLIRSLLYLPLNFIPVVGTLLFLALQGQKTGQRALGRYFELKGFTAKEREEWLRVHEGDYIGFGIASSALEMVPFASFIFACTNTVGAALWAASIEDKSASAVSESESRKAT